MSRGAAAPTHAVIDGSNLATEGRKEPSLAQLREAVAAIRDEYGFTHVTVIVDATFEHRVAKSETKAARTAIDDNEMITPPAGVIGRGDTFILEVANRAGAVVFSNDSFQEFHGTFDWLFDEGRLIGGKPVPSVGWVYVPRSPVRGPVSRRATSASRKTAADPKPAKKARASTAKKTAAKATKTTKAARTSRRSKADAAPPPAPASDDGSNDAKSWKRFRSDYPVGSTIAATVDRFSSHGAYGSVDDIVVYLPNRLLGDPAPTKARDVVDIGTTMDFIVHRFDDERYGVDAGLTPAPGAPSRPAKKARGRTAKKSQAGTAKKSQASTTKKTTAKKTASKSAPRKSAAKKSAATAGTEKKAPARRTAKKSASKASGTAKKSAARSTKKASRRSSG